MNRGPNLGERYQVLSILGEGSMGDVYLCRHLDHERLEAVKVLKPSVADAFTARFRREARAMNRLRHHNIIKVYDFGQLEDGRFFLSMEYAEGVDLERILDNGLISLRRSVSLLIQLADAVDHAHSQGVIHRDLKPANMIVSQDEVVRVLDFGVAKIIAPEAFDSALTGKHIIGTPAYMAPELAQGIGDEPRIDIYALGCIAFHLVVGAPPFSGTPMDVCHAHVTKPPPRPSATSHRDVPEDLEDLILRCLRKKPGTRPHSAATVANILRGVLASLPPDVSDTNVETLRRLPMRASTIRDAQKTLQMGVTPTDPIPKGNGPWQGALRQLAETLVDLGCADAGLLLALTTVGQREGDVARIEHEINHVGMELSSLESRMHDRMLSLRFSLGELQFATQNGTHGDADRVAMEHVIGEIQSQLLTLESDRSNRRTALQDRELVLAAELSDARAQCNESYSELEGCVDSALRGYRTNTEVMKLARHVDGLRPDARPEMQSSREIS